MYLFRLAMASLANRRFTAILTAFAIALSVCLLLAVERVRVEARNSFASTISGTDLIVGARSGSVNLLLYSVFRIGNATNNIRWDSFEHFAEFVMQCVGDFCTEYHFERVSGEGAAAGQFEVLLAAVLVMLEVGLVGAHHAIATVRVAEGNRDRPCHVDPRR